jgi:hypothetical protein
MPTKLNHEIIAAAIEGFQGENTKRDIYLTQVATTGCGLPRRR